MLVARALLLLLAGCNQIYGLDETKIVPGGDFDADDDGFANELDNCPDVANSDQLDSDADNTGDACDNCPVVRNPGQDARGDSDAVGDDCDPAPTVPGDCLVLLDRFLDAATFDTDWQVIANNDPGARQRITHLTSGGLRLMPNGAAELGISSRVTGNFNATVRADLEALTTIDSFFTAVVNFSSTSRYYGCGVGRVNFDVAILHRARTTAGPRDFGVPMSSAPVRADWLARTTVFRGTADRIGCRIDYGVAVGVLNPSTDLPPLPPAGGGVIATVDPVVVRAIALYEQKAECPMPIIR